MTVFSIYVLSRSLRTEWIKRLMNGRSCSRLNSLRSNRGLSLTGIEERTRTRTGQDMIGIEERTGQSSRGSVIFCLVLFRLVLIRLVHIRLFNICLDNSLPKWQFAYITVCILNIWVYFRLNHEFLKHSPTLKQEIPRNWSDKSDNLVVFFSL